MKKAPKIDTLKKKPVQKLANGGTTYSNPNYNGAGGMYGNGPNQQGKFTYGVQSQGNLPATNNYGLSNNQSGLAGMGNQAADLTAGVLGAGALNTMSNNVANERGVVDVNQSKKAGTMGGAATGLKLGATVGLNPALLAATGGLSALAVPAGAAIGAIAGRVGAKKKAISDNKAAEENYAKQQAEQAAADAKAKKEAFYNNNFNRNMSSELTDRYSGFKDGGLIKGKGTPKSDSITAKVEKGSFVVPAVNAPVAKEIKEKVLKAPAMKKANLNQPNGETVKLSTGEYLFSPEESKELMSMGIDLNKLAPDARQRLDEHMNCGGKVHGYKDGGKTGDKPKEKNTNYFKGDKVDPYYTKGSNVKVEPQGKSSKLGKAPSSKTVKKAAPVTTTSTSQNGPFSRDWAELDRDTQLPSETTVIDPQIGSGLTGVTAPEVTVPGAGIIQPNTTNVPDAKTDIGNVLSLGLRGIQDYGLPALQTFYGLKQLQKSGKRPVDSIDNDYLQGITTSRGVVDRANMLADRAGADARYGYSPEELASLNMQNNDATSAARFAARNYSGGSAGNAFNMERTALNDSFGRGLSTKIADRNLRMDKQRYADSRRGYADSKQDSLNALLADKADRSRRLFGDTMNAFQQNQSAGQELVGSGIRNLVSVGRYRDELDANKNRELKYNNI